VRHALARLGVEDDRACVLGERGLDIQHAG
jgi:hypothetical protein